MAIIVLYYYHYANIMSYSIKDIFTQYAVQMANF